MRGGYSSHGDLCGTFYVSANTTASYAYWSFGAALL